MPARKAVMKLNEVAETMSEFIASEDSESAFKTDYFANMFQEIENYDAEYLKRKKSVVEESRKETKK